MAATPAAAGDKLCVRVAGLLTNGLPPVVVIFVLLVFKSEVGVVVIAF